LFSNASGVLVYKVNISICYNLRALSESHKEVLADISADRVSLHALGIMMLNVVVVTLPLDLALNLPLEVSRVLAADESHLDVLVRVGLQLSSHGLEFSPKEEATYNKEAWVGVLETHVNPDNPANGFFELDWNEYFIVQLKSHGYDGPTEESIVEAWFQNLCRNIGNETGVDMEQRGSGYINVQKLDNNRSEVS